MITWRMQRSSRAEPTSQNINKFVELHTQHVKTNRTFVRNASAANRNCIVFGLTGNGEYSGWKLLLKPCTVSAVGGDRSNGCDCCRSSSRYRLVSWYEELAALAANCGCCSGGCRCNESTPKKPFRGFWNEGVKRPGACE